MSRLELEIAELRSSYKIEADETRRMILEEAAKLKEEFKAEIGELGDRIDVLEGRLEELSGQLNELKALILSSLKRLIALILGMLIPMWATIILAVLLRGWGGG